MIWRLAELFVLKSSQEESTKVMNALESTIKSKKGEMADSKKTVEWIPDNIALEIFYKEVSKENMLGSAAIGTTIGTAYATIAAPAVQAVMQIAVAVHAQAAQGQAAHQKGNSIFSTKALDMEESDIAKLDIKQLLSIREDYLK